MAVSLLCGPLFAALSGPSFASATQEGGIEPIRTGGVSVETAALIMSGQEGGQIPLEGLAVPLSSAERPSTDGRTQVLVVIEAAGEALAADHPGGPLAFEVFVYAVNADGALSGTLMQSFEIQQDILGERLRETGIKFVGDLGLPPGQYTLRAMVRSPATKKLGIRGIPVTVPDGPPEPLSPLVVEAEGAWIVARESGPGASPTPLPVPAARPVLALGEEATVQLAPPPSVETDSRLRIALGDAAGTEHEMEGHLGTAAGPAAGFGLMEATFVPADVPAGSYGLRAVMEARGGGTQSGSALPVVLVSRPAEGRYAGVWPALGKMTSSFDRVEPRETLDAGERALQAGLGEVLRALASGDDAKAHARVWELTYSALEGASGDILERAEARRYRAIAEARPESLGPVMVLYDWLYREGLRSNVPIVFSHARTTILKLVNLFLKSSGTSPKAARQAAQMLTSLGGVVQDAGLIEFSEELFLRAIALDSANEATLLALAVNDEKVGNYEAAAGHLKDLLKLDPGHGQARLRMAVNLARDGKPKAAVDHLERLVEGKGSSRHPAWVVSLAYQELAKLHLAADRLEEAGEVLRAGIERRPQDEKLHLLLAFVNDALGKPDEGSRVLSRLHFPRPEAEGSPRHRYTLWPTDALAETRRLFLTTAEAQRADLAKALAEVGTAEENAP